MIRLTLILIVLTLMVAPMAMAQQPVLKLSDDGGWCWYQDERAIIHDGKLIVGTIAAGTKDPNRKGDVELIVHDFAAGKTDRLTLHDKIGLDDHNVPAFETLPDGRVLVIFATHGAKNCFWYRISEPNNPLKWSETKTFAPTEKSSVTYSNIFRLPGENHRIYNFYRGYAASFKPSYAFSDDMGQTWQNGGIVINVPSQFKHRPYAKYASNGQDTIHIVYTEGHPRDFNNNVYHVFYKAGKLHDSKGSVLAELAKGLERPEQGTKLFTGNELNVAWTQDVHLDPQGRPVVAFGVQKDPKVLPPGHPESGQDLRYHYARFDGQSWTQNEIAYAGTRLYPKEDDYAGLICIDPNDINTVCISTNADPKTGKPLISSADSQRHWELYKGTTADAGKTWAWTAITENSTADNIRPIVPKSDGKHTALLWLRGKLRTYTDYDLEVVGKLGR